MIDDSAVDFFGHSLIKAPVSGLHVEDWDLSALGADRGEARVGIAEDQDGIGLVPCHCFIGLDEGVGDGPNRGRIGGFQEFIGLADAQIVEKDLIELVIVILSGVNDDVLDGSIERGHHTT